MTMTPEPTDLPVSPGASEANEPPWYAAQLRPNGLAMAKRNLTRQGFVTFAPFLPPSAQLSRRRQTPLFPGYIFIALSDPVAHWAQLNATRGLTRLIAGAPQRPTAIPQDFIDALRARCDEEGALVRGPEGLTVGTLVKIQQGPFAQSVSRIEHISANDRITLLLDMMGQAIRVQVPRASVDRVR